MVSENLLSWPAFLAVLDTLLPDFILAFTFFTALSYATLGRLFGRQKPAVAMSGSLGLALAVGLVWWEREHGWSIRSLGPVAVGFALIMLVMVVYRAIRRPGGSWAGVALALGICILVAGTFGINWPAAGEVVQAVAIVALILGLLAFLFHHHGTPSQTCFLPTPARREIVNLKRDMIDVRKDRDVSNWLRRGLRKLRAQSEDLVDRPEERTDVMLQLRRMLPAEGWLTERMARLREKAHYIRKGHIARLSETKSMYAKLPTPAKREAAADLVSRYRQLAGIDERLERLDRAVAENERRIKVLTREAHDVVARYEFQKVEGLLKAAERLQGHNAKLCKRIERTEQKLIDVAQKAAGEARGE
jgi:hypothetical protein